MSNATLANKGGWLRRFRDDRGAATAVEVALIFMLLLAVSLGTIEFGYMLFQWNSAEKATHLAVRKAAVSGLVAPGLAAYGSTPSQGADYGQFCTKPDGTPHPDCTFSAVTCTSTGCTGGGFDGTKFTAILTEARRLYPDLQANQLQIQYGFTGLGFIGRPGGQPVAITVRLVNLNYDPMVADVLFGLSSLIPMPNFAATLIGEDQAD